jgi:hypothetical protein
MVFGRPKTAMWPMLRDCRSVNFASSRLIFSGKDVPWQP